MSVFRALAALLTYPTEDLVSALPELRAHLRDETRLPDALRQGLGELCDRLQHSDLWDLQARYVELFDQSRSLSLHIYEHVHGESRDRGQAMVDLLECYGNAGLELEARELPDFLPVYMEYLSQLPADAVPRQTPEVARVATLLEDRLRRRESPYAAVMGALRHLTGAATEAQETRGQPEPHPDLVWQETPVDFSRPPVAKET